MIQAEVRPDFFEKGLCWGRPELLSVFFPDNENEGSAQARLYCTRCPVAAACRDYAVANEINYGVWGGLSYRERERYRRNPEAFKLKKATCEECGELLEGRHRIYCSAPCVRRAAGRRKRMGVVLPVVCEMCGKEFNARSSTQKLCGPECRKADATQRTQARRSARRDAAARRVACWECGAPADVRAKYCSDTCRARARKQGAA